jgi:signal peptidase II
MNEPRPIPPAADPDFGASSAPRAHRAAASRGALRARQYLLSLGVFTLDQLTKGWIERLPAGGTIRVIPHFFQIVQVYNRGAAFGILQDSRSRWTLDGLVAISLLALGVIIGLLWKSPLSRRAGWALALILGGAAGNLFDRLLRGRVTDFLLLYIGRYQWPAFNVADSAIVIGAALLIWDILLAKGAPNPELMPGRPQP